MSKPPVKNSKPGPSKSSVARKEPPKPAHEKKAEPAARAASAKITAEAATHPKPVEKPVIPQRDSNLKEIINLIYDSNEGDDSCFAIIDPTDRVSAFLRHRDVNYINCMDTAAMTPERVRMALIGALRFGKPLAFDLMDSDNLLENIEISCGELDPKLFEELCTKSILKEERFKRFVKESDGEEYKTYLFSEEIYKRFQVVFLINKGAPCDKFFKLGKTFIIS